MGWDRRVAVERDGGGRWREYQERRDYDVTGRRIRRSESGELRQNQGKNRIFRYRGVFDPLHPLHQYKLLIFCGLPCSG
jgi:hypothetical protein